LCGKFQLHDFLADNGGKKKLCRLTVFHQILEDYVVYGIGDVPSSLIVIKYNCGAKI
jgi:hypothetical protein